MTTDVVSKTVLCVDTLYLRWENSIPHRGQDKS